MDTKGIKTTKKNKKRIARGGSRGGTSGRGHKGQKSRAGRRIRPAERDVIARIPKLRGHNKNRARGTNSGKLIPETVTLTTISKNFKDGSLVNPSKLVDVGVVKRQRGRKPIVKIVATGKLDKKVSIHNCLMSKKAQEKITKVGGSIKTI